MAKTLSVTRAANQGGEPDADDGDDRTAASSARARKGCLLRHAFAFAVRT